MLHTDKQEFNGLSLFVFRFVSSPSFPPRINFRCAVFVINDDGVSPIGIDYNCAIAVMYGSGMSPIGIDYNCAIAVMYGGGMSSVRINYC